MRTHIENSAAVAEFLARAASLARKAARHGKIFSIYHEASLPHFTAASPARRAQALKFLSILDDSFDEQEEEAYFEAEKRALWKSIGLLGFMPPESLFDKIKPNRAIEIFDLEGALIWRNLACIDLCSYTLEEVACIDVWRRYDRGAGVTAECQRKLGIILAGGVARDPEISAYPMSETLSVDRLRLRVKHELVCGLKDRGGENRAFLAMTAAEVTGRVLSESNFRSGLSLVPEIREGI